MNRYDYDFTAVCPSDGTDIDYHLAIETSDVVMAEEIVKACQFLEPVYHEAAADALFEKFGGRQIMNAVHQGVYILTTRPHDDAGTGLGC